MGLLKRAAAFAGGAILTAGLALGAAKKDEPAIWTIQKPNGTTITFFGSVHLLPDGEGWRTKALLVAYDTGASGPLAAISNTVGTLGGALVLARGEGPGRRLGGRR